MCISDLSVYYTFNLRELNRAENAKLVKLKTNNASYVTTKEWKEVGTKTKACSNRSNYARHSFVQILNTLLEHYGYWNIGR